MGWQEVVLAFSSAIVGGVVGWFGHNAWSQRTRGDNSPTIKADGGSSITTAGRDITTVNAGPRPTAKLVVYKRPGRMNTYHIRNSGSLDASEVEWGVDGDRTRVMSDVDQRIGIVSSGADFRLAYDVTSMGDLHAKIWVTWSNPDGSPGRFELPV